MRKGKNFGCELSPAASYSEMSHWSQLSIFINIQLGEVQLKIYYVAVLVKEENNINLFSLQIVILSKN